MDITLIAIGLFVLVAVVFLSLFLFKNINKKSFTAEDGSSFSTQSELDSYQILYEKTKSLFLVDNNDGLNNQNLGFDKSFLTKLTNEGFPDLKTLFKYRIQIKSISDLINT